MEERLLIVITQTEDISSIASMSLTSKWWRTKFQKDDFLRDIVVLYREIRRALKEHHLAVAHDDLFQIFDLIGRSTKHGILTYTYYRDDVRFLREIIAIIAELPGIWRLLPDNDRTATMKDFVLSHLRNEGKYHLMLLIPGVELAHYEVNLVRTPRHSCTCDFAGPLANAEAHYQDLLQILAQRNVEPTVILDIRYRDTPNRWVDYIDERDYSQHHTLWSISWMKHGISVCANYRHAPAVMSKSGRFDDDHCTNTVVVTNHTTVAGLQWYLQMLPVQAFPTIDKSAYPLRVGNLALVSAIIDGNPNYSSYWYYDPLLVVLRNHIVHGRYHIVQYMEERHNLGLPFLIRKLQNSCLLWKTLLQVVKKGHLRELEVLLEQDPWHYRFCNDLDTRGRCDECDYEHSARRIPSSWDEVLEVNNWALCRAAWRVGKGKGARYRPPGPRANFDLLVQKLTPTAHTQMLAALGIAEV